MIPLSFLHYRISTHTLTWSVTLPSFSHSFSLKNFNSHAHVERDIYAVMKCIYVQISTHTLTWSVTLLLTMETWQHTDFNSHAHVERDVPVLPLETYLKNFNSHAHVERDVFPKPNHYIINHFNSHAHVERDIYAVMKCIYVQISTHTLTWSVTRSDNHQNGEQKQFQLTRSRGA